MDVSNFTLFRDLDPAYLSASAARTGFEIDDRKRYSRSNPSCLLDCDRACCVNSLAYFAWQAPAGYRTSHYQCSVLIYHLGWLCLKLGWRHYRYLSYTCTTFSQRRSLSAFPVKVSLLWAIDACTDYFQANLRLRYYSLLNLREGSLEVQADRATDRIEFWTPTIPTTTMRKTMQLIIGETAAQSMS
jgi:hypothetical protein